MHVQKWFITYLIIMLLLACFFVAPPFLISGYVTSISLIIFATFSLLVTTAITGKITVPSDFYIYILFLAGCILSTLNSLPDIRNIWELRDSIRVYLSVIFFLAFYSSFKETSEENVTSLLRNILFLMAAYVSIEGLFACMWLLDRSSISFLSMYNEFASRGFTYINYWRYIGLQGNPNFTGLISGTCLIFLWNFKWVFKRRLYLKRLYYPVLLLGLATLILSSSRTVFVALLGSYIIIKFIGAKYSSRERWQLIGLTSFFIIFLAVILNTVDSYFIQRISTVLNYSENDRVQVLFTFLEFYSNNLEVPLLGTFSSDLPLDYLDNDYLFIITKFGLLGIIFILTLTIRVAYIGFVLWKRDVSSNKAFGKSLMQLSIFYLIAAIGGVPYSNPETFFIFIIVHIIGTLFLEKIIK